MQKCHFRLHTDNLGSLISLQLSLFSCFASKPNINDEKYLSKLCFSVFMELAYAFLSGFFIDFVLKWVCFFCINYLMKFYRPFRVQLSFTAFYIEFSSYKMSSKRVLTYLKRGQDIVLAPFGQCVVSSFVKDYTEQSEVEIHCDLAPQVKSFIILWCFTFSIWRLSLSLVCMKWFFISYPVLGEMVFCYKNCKEFCLSFLCTLCENPEIWTGQNRSSILWYVVLIMK